MMMMMMSTADMATISTVPADPHLQVFENEDTPTEPDFTRAHVEGFRSAQRSVDSALLKVRLLRPGQASYFLRQMAKLSDVATENESLAEHHQAKAGRLRALADRLDLSVALR